MLRTLAAVLLCSAAALSAQAGSLQLCSKPADPTAEQKDRLLRFAAVIKAELQDSGQALALVSRSGLDLERFKLRYSHAGVSLRDSANAPWSVRQLYYDCETEKPRLYDEGLSGFVMGTHDADLGYASLVLLPSDAAASLAEAALDDERAKALLGERYSANAYAFGLRYQNCNQWLVELLAGAWSGAASREPAQRWLGEQGYQPRVIDVGWRPLMWLARLIPWLHSDDHPEADLADQRYRISLPDAIEAFVHERWPEARRIEFCHDRERIVVRRGWKPLGESCRAEDGDQVLPY
ncbi:DUF2145 domain-containing protein [Pelomonas sp. SE-A7]|uniref:DUF2145 domain-containing protein n=1 Tax=Pelomonas sp. SE-A7 TaxID=3054953 RepID=UPI00259CDAE6|nr:DUF2145 domain-containing protein [Pelomonas sp. SE-A7]MDM4768151.1 DUF2145 domain-containing protein [Pelomonas sp. SE-A7]